MTCPQPDHQRAASSWCRRGWQSIMSRNLRRRDRQRQGVAILVVLALISATLAMSYAMLRSQATMLQVEQNSQRDSSARVAALSGLSAALRRMHQSDWAGADTKLTGTLGSGLSYEAEYITGDESLLPSDAKYAEYPFRITLLVTGKSADAQNSTILSTHQIRAVVRLVPRQLNTVPADWPTMQNYTFFQIRNDSFWLHAPCRIEGPIWVQGQLQFYPSAPIASTPRSRLLSDLNLMRQNGLPDRRPLTGPVSWVASRQTTTNTALMASQGITPISVADKIASPWSAPATPYNYQLYTGGKSYSVPRLSESQWNNTWGPDPKTNPAGIYCRLGSLLLYDNVKFQGTVFATTDIHVYGKNVQLSPVDLPPLSGTTQPVRLQTAAVNDDFRVWDDATLNVKGVLCVWDEFNRQSGPDTADVLVEGRIISRAFMIDPAWNWSYSDYEWNLLHTLFLNQLAGSTPLLYFPSYLELFGRKTDPKVVIRPGTQEFRAHWLVGGQAVYVAHSSDPGLRWEMLSWSDVPQ